MSLFAAIAVTAATCVLLNKRRLKDSIDTPLSPLPAPSSSLLPSDEWYIQKLRSMLYMLKAPIHSGLLVCAVIRYYDASGRQRYVTGQNGEPCVIAGSLCAERAALMKVIEAGGVKLHTAYITASCPQELTPGMLCRQMLCELGYPQLRFVLVSPTSVSVRSLVELFPFPALYRGVSGADVVAHAEAFGSTCQSITASPDWATAPAALQSALAQGQVKTLYSQTLNRAQQKDPKDAVHPLRYAAGILFASGDIVVTLGDRLAEYGCTLDACCKFARELEIRPSGDTPLLLVQVDQAGVLHAPHAQARAYFHECGRDDVVVPIHDAAGIVSLRTIAQLCPASPLLEGGYEARNIIGKR